MNLLLTGAWPQATEFIPELERRGHKIVFAQQESEPLPCAYDWVEGIVGNGIFLHHPIEQFVNLKFIQLTSAGFDRVPMDYVQAHNIKICNARGVYSIPMAEFALCGVLQLYKQAEFFRAGQRAHRWDKHRGLLELNGKTVCVVGCGSVGTECAKRFAAFGSMVVGVDLFPREDATYVRMVGLDALDEELPEADVLVLTLPLTEQTRHMMDARRFARMKPGAVLVNIARGGVVETQALVDALNKTLAGAVLDVFEEEPLGVDSPLWDMEQVLITPHNSFVSDCNNERLGKIILDNLGD